jgi:hypothetical protein
MKWINGRGYEKSEPFPLILYNKECHNLYRSSSNVNIVMCRRIQASGHTAWMEGTQNAYSHSESEDLMTEKDMGG